MRSSESSGGRKPESLEPYHLKPGGIVAAGFMVAVAIGIALRVLEFINCRSLGLDEARLAVNIASRPFSRLLAPLVLDQVAPVLFLWVERLSLTVFGHGACALRIVPVSAGIAGALLMYPLALRFLGIPEARLATLIGLLCPLLITYSDAVKQYSTEYFFAILFVWLWDRAASSDATRGSRTALLVAGGLGPWLSLSSPFLLSACWVDLTSRAGRGGRRMTSLALSATLLWSLSGGAAYLLAYGRARTSPYLQRFWEHAFLVPTRPGVLADSWRVLKDLVWGFLAGDPLVPAGALSPAIPILAAGFLGLVLIGSRVVLLGGGGGALWRLVGPCLALGAASMAGVFPVAPRLALFALPALVVLFVAGLKTACSWGGLKMSGFAVVAVLLIVPLTLYDFARAFSLEPPEHFRALVHELHEWRLPGEPVYVFARSLPAWIYYSTDWGHPDTVRLSRLIDLASAAGAAFENAPSRGIVQDSDTTSVSLPSAGAPELIGLPSGMEWREVVGHVATKPDSGWVGVESRRIQAAATPGIWVLASSFYVPEAQLFSVLERTATRRTFAHLRGGSALVRYEFGLADSHARR